MTQRTINSSGMDDLPERNEMLLVCERVAGYVNVYMNFSSHQADIQKLVAYVRARESYQSAVPESVNEKS